MSFIIVWMVLVGLFPWALAAMITLLIVAGSDAARDSDRPDGSSYQPMRILTSHSPQAEAGT